MMLQPVDMILRCPACGLQHIDAPDERSALWTNPPHRSHLCHGCGHIWRPADVPTNGVAVIATKGSADSPAAAPAPVSGMPDLAVLRDAQRYRWLRVNNIVTNVRFHFANGESPYLYAEALDEAIDHNSGNEPVATLPAAPAPTEQADALQTVVDEWALNQMEPDDLRDEVRKLRAALAARQAPTPAAAEGQADAARWRALLNSPRIRMLGSAGLNKPEPNNYAHFGMEIWSKYSRDYKPELLEEMDRGNALGKEWLTKYADIAIEAQRATLAAPLPRQAAVRGEDTARLDWLEQAAESLGGLMLHDGRHPAPGRNGLGLRYMGRTLRQAVDACMPTPAKVSAPSENSPAPTVKASQ